MPPVNFLVGGTLGLAMGGLAGYGLNKWGHAHAPGTDKPVGKPLLLGVLATGLGSAAAVNGVNMMGASRGYESVGYLLGAGSAAFGTAMAVAGAALLIGALVNGGSNVLDGR